MSARGYAERRERLPETLDAVTAGWLGRTLAHRYPGIMVDRLETVELIQGHTTKLRVRIDARGADLPAALCLKSNWSGSALSGASNANEARFYRELAEPLELPAPACFYADWDDDAEGRQGLIVLEDMGGWDGRFGTSAEPISIDEARKGVEALARLHGATWGDPRLDRADWLQVAMAPETTWDDYWAMMRPHYDHVNRLPERVALFPEWFARAPEKLRQAWLMLREHDLATPGPRCLVHGDAHLGNSYGFASGERLFLDWQIVRKGHPWRDYSYFAIGSITPRDRRVAERDLLRAYLDALAAYGISIAFEQAWDEYRRWTIWGLVAWQSNINPKEATLPSLERFCLAAKDLDVGALYGL